MGKYRGRGWRAAEGRAERACRGDREIGASTRLVSAAPVSLDEIAQSDLAVSTPQRAAARLDRDPVRCGAVALAGAAGIEQVSTRSLEAAAGCNPSMLEGDDLG